MYYFYWNETTCEIYSSFVNIFFKMLALWAYESAWNRVLCNWSACHAPLLWSLGGQLCDGCCQFIPCPSTRVKVAFDDFTHWDSAGFWPWTLHICDLFFFCNPCQVVLKKNFILLSRENYFQFFHVSKVLSFMQVWPIVTQAMRLGLILLSLSFLPAI